MTAPIELTVRDVLTQVDRRLTRLEDDLREFRRYVEERLAAMEDKLDARLAAMDLKFDAIEGRFEARCDAMEQKFDARFDALRTDFRWLLGIVIASWMSVMATLLLR